MKKSAPLPPAQTQVRVSVSEAGRLFGVNQRTIRRALSSNELQYIVVRGRYKINFESLIKWSQKKATVRNKRDKLGIGQLVDQWKIRNKLFSTNPNLVLAPAKEPEKDSKEK